MTGPEIAINKLMILMPVYNDWDAAMQLFPLLDKELIANQMKAEILIVDDGSTDPIPPKFQPTSFRGIESIDVLSLRRNLGHQRAIAIGLCFVEANRPRDAVVVMDCDGEDDPRDVSRLVQECIAHGGRKIIFAARLRRSENFVFKFFYHLYRFTHFLLTGVRVRVGNFSIIPDPALKRLVVVSELWNHYAAAVHKARLPLAVLPTRRGNRLYGKSRMNLVALVVHGLSAMAVFGDRIGVRLLLVVSLGMLLAGTALAAVIGLRIFTQLAIPGWATYAAGLLLVMLMQMLVVLLVFAFVILASRDTASVIPARDYTSLTNGNERLYGDGR